MSQLLVTLDPNAASYAYALVSSANAVVTQGHAAINLLPRADEVIALIAPSALSWHPVQLPKLPRGTTGAKMQAVLAGLLEEQLLDEPGQMHLALCSMAGQSWVAVSDKAWLQSQIQAFEAGGLGLSSLRPLALPLPDEQAMPQAHISGSGQAAALTLRDAHGVLCLPLQHAQALLPSELAISAEPAVAALAEQTLQLRVPVLQTAQHALQAWQNAQTQGIELAQGDLALRGSGRFWSKLFGAFGALLSAPQWSPLRWGFGLLLMAHLIGLNAWAWHQKSALVEQRQQMNQLLTSSFPNVKVVLDAPVQMQRELLNLRQAQGQLSSKDFESLYSRFAAIANMSQAPQSIDFANGEISIKGSGLGAAQLNPLMEKFEFAGLQVRSDAQALLISERGAQARTGAAR